MLTREDVFDIIEAVLYENLPDVPEEEVAFVTQKVMDKLEDKGAFDAMDVYDSDDLDSDDDEYEDEEDYSDDESEE
jgi:hypothetical protein